MNLRIFNYLNFSVDVFLIYYSLLKIFNKNINISKRDIIYLMGLAFLNLYTRNLFGLNNFIIFILIPLLSAIIYYFLTDEDLLSVSIYTTLLYLILGLIEILTAYIIVLIFKISFQLTFQFNIYRILIAVVSKTTFYYTVKRFRDKIRLTKSFDIKAKRIISLLFLFNLYIFFIIFMIYNYIGDFSRFTLIRITILVIGFLFFSIYTYKFTKDIIYQNQKELVFKQKQDALYKTDFYAENMKEILRTIKSQRHDLNNHLGTLYGLIYMKKYDRAKEYITKINNEIKSLDMIIDTNNPVITSLLSMKKDKAFKIGINMNIEVQIPEVLDFDSIDLSIILGNLLDNAIEACEKIGASVETYIDIYISLKEDVLYIEIINCKAIDKKLSRKDMLNRFTSKEDFKNHGFGLGNVEFVVNKYNGNIDIRDTGEKFIVYISMPVQKEEASL